MDLIRRFVRSRSLSREGYRAASDSSSEETYSSSDEELIQLEEPVVRQPGVRRPPPPSQTSRCKDNHAHAILPKFNPDNPHRKENPQTEEESLSSVSSGARARIQEIASALDQVSPKGRRLEVKKDRSQSEERPPGKGYYLPPEGVLPEGVYLHNDGFLDIPKIGLRINLASWSNMSPFVRYKSTYLGYSTDFYKWFHFSHAETMAAKNLKRKEMKKQKAIQDQSEYVATLENRIAQLEKQLEAAKPATQSKDKDLDTQIQEYKGDESMPFEKLIAQKSYKELPAFKDGDNYATFLGGFGYWYMQQQFPKQLMHIAAVQRTNQHPKHDVLTHELRHNLIRDWATFKASMKEHFAPRLSPEANLERIATLQMSDKEKSEGDFSSFDYRIQTQLVAALEEVEGITKPVVQFLADFLGKDYFLRGIDQEVGDYVRLQLSVSTRRDAISAATKFATQKNDRGELVRTGNLVGAVTSAGGCFQGKGNTPGGGQRQGRSKGKKKDKPQAAAMDKGQSKEVDGSKKKTTAREMAEFNSRRDVCLQCKTKAVECGFIMGVCNHCLICYSVGHTVAECPNRRQK